MQVCRSGQASPKGSTKSKSTQSFQFNGKPFDHKNKQVCRSGQTGRTQDPLAYAYLGSNPSTCIMDLVSKMDSRIKANHNFMRKLKRVNRYETGLFKERHKVKKRFEIYVAKDDKIIKMIQEDNSNSDEVLKKTIELLESQTKLIIEYGIYKVKYIIVQN